jgi:putative Ca2+/H+ antiporter (TMEM165/GDT1 family)
MTAATFAATALALWRRSPSTASRAVPAPTEPTGRGVAVAFGAVFFTEWGDVGQLTTAALTARYDAPTLVWLAASMALATKGALALALGIGLRRYAPRPLVRRTSIALCVVMGVLAILRSDR